MSAVLCGNASDSIYLTFKGGCRKDLPIEDAYRCTGCGGRFHKDCIMEHFKLEALHDWGRQEERSAGQVAAIQARIDTAKQILATYESGMIGTYTVKFAIWLPLYVTDLEGQLAELEQANVRQ